MKGADVLSYDDFVVRVGNLLDIDFPAVVNPFADLYDELGLDSLQAYQLIVIVESLADAVPPDDIPELYTMQDAFAYYEALRAPSDSERLG